MDWIILVLILGACGFVVYYNYFMPVEKVDTKTLIGILHEGYLQYMIKGDHSIQSPKRLAQIENELIKRGVHESAWKYIKKPFNEGK